MDLVAQDVAALLKVSEKTVYRWIAQRKLPAHRINEQYRFNRTELLEWATANRVPMSVDILKEEHPVEMPGLSAALKAGGIYYRVCGKDKSAILSEVVAMLPLPAEVDRTFLLEVLLTRESLGSTAIGNGVAIPHVRNPIVMHIPRPMMSLSFLEYPVEFDAIDGQPVHTLFTIVSPTIRAHLHLLSRLSFALQDLDFKAVIARHGLAEEVIRQAAQSDHRIEALSVERGGNQR